jgi:hypothetical protein
VSPLFAIRLPASYGPEAAGKLATWRGRLIVGTDDGHFGVGPIGELVPVPADDPREHITVGEWFRETTGTQVAW